MNTRASTSLLDTPYPLTNEQITRYWSDGHILLHSVLPSDEITGYRSSEEQAVHESVRRKDTQGRIEEYATLFQQVTNVWRLREKLQRLVFAKRFAGIAATLMGVGGVRLYHDQALFKLPGGKATPWHQDQFYWPLDTTMWMPLVDVTEALGTMRFVSGSHAHGPLGRLSISDKAHEAYEEVIRAHEFRVVSEALQAGDATFHAGWTAHSTYPNTSDTIRDVITIIYYADGTRLLEPDNEFQKTDMEVFHPGQKPGEVAASELNPLLYP